MDEEQLITFVGKCIEEWNRGQSTVYSDYDEFLEQYVKPLIKKTFGEYLTFLKLLKKLCSTVDVQTVSSEISKDQKRRLLRF